MSWSTDIMQRLRGLGFVATDDNKWEARIGSLKVTALFNEDGDFFLGSNRDGSLGAGSLRILHPTASVEQIADSICQMHEQLCGVRPDLPIADLAISTPP